MLEENSQVKIDQESIEKDWRLNLVDRLRNKYVETVVIVQPWDYDSGENSLARRLDAKKEDLPRIYFIDAVSDKVVMYPRKLDYANKFTEELISNWKQMNKLEIIVTIKQNKLVEYPDEGNEMILFNLAMLESSLGIYKNLYEEELKKLGEESHLTDNVEL